MGLIKAAVGSIGGVFADQWKEFFVCESLDADTLLAKGERQKGRRSGNNGSDNVISNGSVISVADGQCAIIVESGKVVELAAEPGAFTYDKSNEPSIFSGDLGENVVDIFGEIARRFSFGGDTGKDQRVYYINTKEITGNKYGTPSDVPFKVTDEASGLNLLVRIRCFGQYSYRITNPILFYTNVAGNAADVYTRDQIDSQLKTELLTALQPAFARISAQHIDYTELPGRTLELADALNDVLSKKWRDLRGIEIVSFGVSSVRANEADEEKLQKIQMGTAIGGRPDIAMGMAADAQADAMRMAAQNEGGGAAMGLFGMQMAGQAGAGLYQQAAQMAAQRPAQNVGRPAAPATGTWTCACGTANTGKFCQNCGKPKPAATGAWTCSCGTQNTGKFCTNCGKPRPAGDWTCSCGTKNTGKFCQNCGKPRP
ncbi:SPFH domain-containing protein [Selenomonas sp.]|uniref:SPFH domain-containing protein n=1 Tax=Selenomonas sp. TaxID=2053611 RepID=UPI0025F6ABC8|nr:SPFH domain-containing protein [Selenomonas sp.]MCI6085319.1 SPFH domain-containing protein [Selenomonas sp.]MDY3297043.1 SPFH domain-containing protein [Selenomonas sp.]